MRDIPDVDIDLKNREEVLSKLPHVPASIHRLPNIEKHKSGVYFQKVPKDHITGWCSLDYKRSEQLGYVKVDLLHNGVYKAVRDPDHLRSLTKTDPDWSLLDHKEVVETLFQLHDHYEVVKQMKPCSLSELAMTIAIIRPAKKHLIGESWEKIRAEIWQKDVGEERYQFKMSHSFGYALVIIVQLNLLMEELNG